jgi:hypothetical protein
LSVCSVSPSNLNSMHAAPSVPLNRTTCNPFHYICSSRQPPLRRRGAAHFAISPAHSY